MDCEDSLPGGGRFNTTHWSVVLLAGRADSAQAGAALEQLCRNYWYPLYAYVRRKGHSPHDAQDLTQEFFARLLEKEFISLATKERGRFRSFLLKSLDRFLINDWVKNKAQKRGRGEAVLSLDEENAERIYKLEENQLPPENLYDRRWALTLLERAMDRLRTEYKTAGKQDLFEQLREWLLEEGTGEAYRQLAERNGSSEGAIKVAVHRLRQRFRDAVRSEIAETVSTSEEIEEEMRCLMANLQGR